MLSDRNLKLVFKMVVIAGWGGGGGFSGRDIGTLELPELVCVI